jgi:DNA-binding FadR family transcriptional regulator
MMTPAQEAVADAIAELHKLGDHYRALTQSWLAERRAIIDICLAHGDVATVEAILSHLEKSCDWQRWPAESH